MAKVLQVVDNNTVNAGVTEYTVCANSGFNGGTSEAPRQITYRSAGTLSNLWVYVDANTSNGSTTHRTRINGANGAQSVSISAAATGAFEDASNTDSVAAGDEVNYQTAAGGTTGNLVLRTHGIVFSATTNTVIRHGIAGGTTSFNSTTEFAPLAGGGQHVSAEAEVKFDINSAGTLKNLYMYVDANTRTTTSTQKSRINAADGAMAVSITASSTGVFEDTVNTDTVAANDDINYACTQGSGGGDLLRTITSLEFETTNNKFHSLQTAPGGITQSANTTRYYQIGSDGNALTTEAPAQAELNISATVSNLFIYISANSVTLASTFDVRQDATSTAVTISITASTTGAFEDAVNSEALVAADLVNFRIVAPNSGTSLTWRVMGCMFENTETAGAATYPGYYGSPGGWF